MNVAAKQTARLAKNLVLRVDQKIAVVMKPKPMFVPQKLWLWIASQFIYIEQTDPSFMVREELE